MIASEDQATAAPVEKMPWPPWAPWVLAFVLMAFHDVLDRLYTPALFASLGIGLGATALCLLVGARHRSRARAYWLVAGLLTLALATPMLLVLAPAALLILVGLLVLVVAGRWFAQGPQGPPHHIRTHLACALILWFLSWFIVFLSHGRNGILLIVPALWILWTARVALRATRRAEAALEVPPR